MGAMVIARVLPDIYQLERLNSRVKEHRTTAHVPQLKVHKNQIDGLDDGEDIEDEAQGQEIEDAFTKEKNAHQQQERRESSTNK